jgi:release factor glutamine methyltransferase
MTLVGIAAENVVHRLRAAGCVAADEEAEELLAKAPDSAALETWVRRREQGEPLAWVTGDVQFCGHTIRVDPGVYVPRRQSEGLAHRAAARLAADGGSAVDLCTGAGAVAVHLRSAAPHAAVIGVDVDLVAVRCARRNGVCAVVSDLDGALRPGSFAVVSAVAPYVPTAEMHLLPADVRRYEPRLALDGGTDGLALVRRVVAAAVRLLRPGGWLFIEVGGYQDRALASTLAAFRFDVAETWYDEDGDLRGIVAQAAVSDRHR